MAALTDGGMYREYSHGLTFKDILGDDKSIMVEDEIADIIFSSFDKDKENSEQYRKQEIMQLIPALVDMLKERPLNINKDQILKLLITKYIDSDPMSEVSDVQVDQWSKYINRIIKTIKINIGAQTRMEKAIRSANGTHMQNFILETMLDMYRSPITLMASTNPTTMDPVKNAVASLPDSAKALRSHFDPTTGVFVNQTTSVGKKDIGISAVAQKAFYVLGYYDHLKKERKQSIFNLDSLTLPSEWGGSQIVSLGFPNTKIDRNSLQLLYNKLMFINRGKVSGEVTYKGITFHYKFDESSQIPSIQYEVAQWKDLEVETLMSELRITEIDSLLSLFLKNNDNKLTGEVKINGRTFDYDFSNAKSLKIREKSVTLHRMDVGMSLGKYSVTTINSAIISSSTDNAKEMIMDLLNATPEILPAYEYLLSIGVDLNVAAKILTDDLCKAIITTVRGNLFNQDKGYYKAVDVFTKTGRSAVEAIYKNYGYDSIDDAKWKILEKLFKGAQELTIIGQTLGINQGIKVEFGEPLLYKLKLERQVNEVIGENTFELDKFLAGYQNGGEYVMTEYAQTYINKYEEHMQKYNLLDIIFSVEHYHAMCRIPLQFKTTMQLLSKDIDNVYTIAEKAKKIRWNEDNLRDLLRAVNDKKIADFLSSYDFSYTPQVVYRLKGGTISNVDSQGNYKRISTTSREGLLSLKRHIENIIIPWLKERYQNNAFLDNLVPSKSFNSLFGTKVSFYGSRISLTDQNNIDLVYAISEAFNKINQDSKMNLNTDEYAILEGHSILEWMFMYDLIVNKHTTSRNSITLLFENGVDMNDPSNIITQYVQYINDYDSYFQTFKSSLAPFKTLTTPKEKKSRYNSQEAAFEAEMEMMAMMENEHLHKKKKETSYPWAPNPNVLPLFIDISTQYDRLLDRDELYELFNNGNLVVKIC